MLAGYNAQKAGLSYNYLESNLWNVTLDTAAKSYAINSREYFDALQDEKVDQIAYRY